MLAELVHEGVDVARVELGPALFPLVGHNTKLESRHQLRQYWDSTHAKLEIRTVRPPWHRPRTRPCSRPIQVASGLAKLQTERKPADQSRVANLTQPVASWRR